MHVNKDRPKEYIKDFVIKNDRILFKFMVN
jgi:hypothetical protein